MQAAANVITAHLASDRSAVGADHPRAQCVGRFAFFDNHRAVALGCLLVTALAAPAAQAQVLSDPQRSWQPDAAQRVALTLNTQALTQTPSWQPRGGLSDMNPAPATQASLGLEFRRKSNSQQAKDLLKVQLTADSVLNFKPRGGGMVVQYRSKF